MPGVQFFIAVGGQQAGPFAPEQLPQLVQNGTLTMQTLVWKQGMPQWAAASTVPELAPLFAPPAGAVPPPIPGV